MGTSGSDDFVPQNGALPLAFPLAGNLQCQISRSKQSREIVATAETQNVFPRCEPDGHVHGQFLLAHPFVGRLREELGSSGAGEAKGI